MHYVDQLFEQHQVAPVRSYTCADEDTIEMLPLQLGLNPIVVRKGCDEYDGYAA